MGRFGWLLAGLLLLATACGGGADTTASGGSTDEPAATDATTETSAPAAGAAVALADSDLGEILVDAEGFTLYLFDQDSEGTSNCTGDCAQTWPPLTVDGEPTGGDGVDAELLGTTARDDGSTQVTYAGHPLYYYAPDEAPGDTTGQAVGDVWWVVGPDGTAIKDSAAAGDEGPSYDY